MTGDELKVARQSLGLTQQQMADALGMGGVYGRISINKYERGHTPIPGPVAIAVKCLVEHGD